MSFLTGTSLILVQKRYSKFLRRHHIKTALASSSSMEEISEVLDEIGFRNISGDFKRRNVSGEQAKPGDLYRDDEVPSCGTGEVYCS